jgi:eukaryotic-like serine/threonine-protein kinase
MNGDESDEVAVFTQVIKVPREHRAAFLDKACAGNDELRRKVEALLSAHDRMGYFLEEPPNGGQTNGEN